MEDSPAWLPDLILLSDHGDDWHRYIDAAFAIFYRDFIESQPEFQKQWVRCRRDPMFDGKEAGFWHCVSGGPNETQRVPDLRRCERIGWIKALMEKSGECDCWPNFRKNEKRWCVWFNEEYLVVLGERKRKRNGLRYMQLITAYCTEEKPRKRKLRKERDEYLRSINV